MRGVEIISGEEHETSHGRKFHPSQSSQSSVFKKGQSSAKLGANPAGSGVGVVGHGV